MTGEWRVSWYLVEREVEECVSCCVKTRTWPTWDPDVFLLCFCLCHSLRFTAQIVHAADILQVQDWCASCIQLLLGGIRPKATASQQQHRLLLFSIPCISFLLRFFRVVLASLVSAVAISSFHTFVVIAERLWLTAGSNLWSHDNYCIMTGLDDNCGTAADVCLCWETSFPWIAFDTIWPGTVRLCDISYIWMPQRKLLHQELRMKIE